MSSFLAMLLIKDVIDNRVVYYWADESESQESPSFPNLSNAEEWWVQENFSAYEGIERRGSIHDRRKLQDHLKTEQLSGFIKRLNPNGRRYTDEPIRISIDKSRVKILQLYSQEPDLLTCNEQLT